MTKILMIGCDKGSWQMRGRQLGRVIGAHCVAKPKASDWAWADRVILVKRAAEVWFTEATACGAALVWDVLDFWRQPTANQRSADALIRDVEQMRRALGAVQVIGATHAMAHDIGGVYLPHHSRPGLRPTPIRPTAKTVAYEGAERYLGAWRPALARACAAVGLQFVVNPPHLSDADLIVAFRDREWDGWACRQWKSGVKYVNALAAGRPVLTQASAGYHEIGARGVVVEDPSELADALRHAIDADFRQQAFEEARAREGEFSLEVVGRRYQQILTGVDA